MMNTQFTQIVRLIVLMLPLLSLSACITNPIPKGYTGPTATIRDTVLSESDDFPGRPMFYVSKIDGQAIENSEHASQVANHGKGLSMDPVTTERNIPVRKMVLTLVGRNVHAAPIQEMFHELRGKNYKVTGNVDFEPQADHFYIVRGVLGPELSNVWVEDLQANTVVTQKIEIKKKK